MYCTLNDIRTKRLSEETLIQITDDADAGVIDAVKVDRAIADAGELIDGYLRTRYALPLTPVPGLVAALALHIVVWNLYGLRPDVETPERVASDYKGALALLERVQRGDVKLGVAEPAGQEATEALQVATPATIFDADTLGQY